VGDTLVDGHIAQRIAHRDVMTQLWSTDTLIEQTHPDVVTRIDGSGVVLQWSISTLQWDTLYWFSASPGDQWTPPWTQTGEPCAQDVRWVVADTGTLVIEGVTLRTLNVWRFMGSDTLGGMHALELFIERIGTAEGYFAPFPHCGAIIECFCTFSCYTDNTVNYVRPNGACGLGLSVHENGAAPDPWTVFPNPGYDRLTILHSSYQGPVMLEFFDPRGDLVLAKQVTREGTIDVLPLANGLYVYRVARMDGGGVVWGRWVKAP
jgi:hypothetical protein